MPPASKSVKPSCPTCAGRQRRSGEPPWAALLQALSEQTQAMHRLAASNEALVDALMQCEEEEPEGSPHL